VTRRARRKRLAVGLLLALAGAPPAAAASSADADAACLAQEPVARYLHDVQGRILDAWELPPDGLADREVVLRLRIDADGMLLSYELVSFSDRRLAQSVKYAVMLASPFPPIPSEARCVAGRSIVTTFSNPP
jgi:outer membrane biosynthesis protein TonB